MKRHVVTDRYSSKQHTLSAEAKLARAIEIGPPCPCGMDDSWRVTLLTAAHLSTSWDLVGMPCTAAQTLAAWSTMDAGMGRLCC